MLELLPDLITLIGLEIGFQSIYLAATGRFYEAARLFFLALFFDYLDGMAARLLGVESPRGEVLDRAVDRVNQCVAPAVLYAAAGGPLESAVASLLVIVGIVRLSIPKDSRYFRGAPLFIPALLIECSVLAGLDLHPLILLPFILATGLPIPYPRSQATSVGEGGGWRRLLWGLRPILPLVMILGPTELVSPLSKAVVILAAAYTIVGPAIARMRWVGEPIWAENRG
ncbi:MAG: CDP-alcohol phosphatidyltransferase family protein [Candidatus Korarchaeota archaeon]|nr:CDP-alcohol phosphatidyltransferase family protein [Candidatus Korarchaeota archaeon]